VAFLAGIEERMGTAEKQAGGSGRVPRNPSVGSEIRDRLLSRIKPVLAAADTLSDTGMRLAIQACCLDLVTDVEDVIEQLKLDDLGVGGGGQ
jgi:hypothetical protein